MEWKFTEAEEAKLSTIEDISIEEAKILLESAPWRFAKTMADIPHSYTLRRNWNDDIYLKVWKFVRVHSTNKEMFYKTPFYYFYLGEYKYWVLTNDIDVTILINRTKIENKYS